MEVIAFKSATASRSACDTITIALFNGDGTPECVAIVKCETVTARALQEEIGSALGSKSIDV